MSVRNFQNLLAPRNLTHSNNNVGDDDDDENDDERVADNADVNEEGDKEGATTASSILGLPRHYRLRRHNQANQANNNNNNSDCSSLSPTPRSAGAAGASSSGGSQFPPLPPPLPSPQSRVTTTAHQQNPQQQQHPDTRKLLQNLVVQRVIGIGVSSTVVEVSPAANASSNNGNMVSLFAAKIIPRRITDTHHCALIQREVELLRRFQDHPLVVRLHAVVQDVNCVVLLMERAAGGSLRSLLNRMPHRRLEIESSRQRIVSEVLSVLQLMHFRGVAMRDIKPENVLISSRPSSGHHHHHHHHHMHIALCDFGLSKEIHGSNSSNNPTPVVVEIVSSATSASRQQTPSSSSNTTLMVSPSKFAAAATPRHFVFANGKNTPVQQQQQQQSTVVQNKHEFVGSPAYMSPELVRASPTACPLRDDMWALGCLHYELCFSRPPFAGSSEEDTLARIAAARTVRDIPLPEWPAQSVAERDFMLKLLSYGSLTADGAVRHPWMMQQHQRKQQLPQQDSVVENEELSTALRDDAVGQQPLQRTLLLDYINNNIIHSGAGCSTSTNLPAPWFASDESRELMMMLLLQTQQHQQQRNEEGNAAPAAAAAAAAAESPVRERLSRTKPVCGAVPLVLQQQPNQQQQQLVERKTSGGGLSALRSFFASF